MSKELTKTIDGIRYAVRYRNKNFYMEEMCLEEEDAVELAVFILDCAVGPIEVEEVLHSVKPSPVNRYLVNHNDNTLTATMTDEWQSQLKKATDSLCRDIIAGEEKFIISEFETEALESLHSKIEGELTRRRSSDST